MKNIYVDFDGVINSYKTRFTTVEELPDPPVPGAIEWLRSLIKRFNVTIYTARMLDGRSQSFIMTWLLKYGMPMREIEQLSFSCVKGSADLYIDDRAYRFEGIFPDPDEIEAIEPWHKVDR